MASDETSRQCFRWSKSYTFQIIITKSKSDLFI